MRSRKGARGDSSLYSRRSGAAIKELFTEVCSRTALAVCL